MERECVKRYWYEKEIEMREERGTEIGEEGVRKAEIQSEETTFLQRTITCTVAVNEKRQNRKTNYEI